LDPPQKLLIKDIEIQSILRYTMAPVILCPEGAFVFLCVTLWLKKMENKEIK
jgi:hypothetical protein